HLALSAKTYLTIMISKNEKLLMHEFKQRKIPMASDCHPELNDTSFLRGNDIALYCVMMGNCNWAITEQTS
ncbi:MAG: hypothetical protein AAGB04_22030, partial [Pseudomonadota bacterium]